MSQHVEWTNAKAGPELVGPSGIQANGQPFEDSYGSRIDDYGILVGDEDVTVVEGTLDELDAFADRLKAQVAAKRPRTFPMPGTLLGGHLVIASCHHIDEPEREPEAIVLLLNDGPPFYTVAEVQYMQEGPPVICATEDYPNIVPAADAYQEHSGAWGGDR